MAGGEAASTAACLMQRGRACSQVVARTQAGLVPELNLQPPVQELMQCVKGPSAAGRLPGSCAPTCPSLQGGKSVPDSRRHGLWNATVPPTPCHHLSTTACMHPCSIPAGRPGSLKACRARCACKALPSSRRLDFVRGFHGSHVRDYVRATQPSFVVGEFWDSLAYSGGLPDHNQV